MAIPTKDEVNFRPNDYLGSCYRCAYSVLDSVQGLYFCQGLQQRIMFPSHSTCDRWAFHRDDEASLSRDWVETWNVL